MYRFKPSKYKNAVPRVPKRGEGWILDLAVGSPQGYGSLIKASAAFVAFNIETRGGGCLGFLPLTTHGRRGKDLPLLHAHSDYITDFDFSPFDDGLLATGSADCLIKLWQFPEAGLVPGTQTNPIVVLPTSSSRIDCLQFHPVIDSLLTSTNGKTLKIWDVCEKEEVWTSTNHDDTVQSFSWKSDGSLLVSSCKDRKLRILDPRSSFVAQETNCHCNNRDSRVVWLGDTDRVISTGFGNAREREIILRDVRNISQPLATHCGDSCTGILVPLFDPDTNMLFLAAKADTTISFWEILDNQPYWCEATKHMGDVQTKGACLVPKRALKIMDGEVNRVLILGPDCIVPLTFQVPRKSYREFHADIFPDTAAPQPAMNVKEWLAGENQKRSKISLDPIKNQNRPKFGHKFGNIVKQESVQMIEVPPPPAFRNEPDGQILRKPALAPKPKSRSPSPAQKPAALTRGSSQDQTTTFRSNNNTNGYRHENPFRRMRVTKFRHLKGTVPSKESHITNLANINKAIPGESNGFQANPERLAVPMATSGGHVAVIELAKRGRLESRILPGVICGSAVTDFVWDPFRNNHLITACDTGWIQLWKIPPEGLLNQTNAPHSQLVGHNEKVYSLKFHPLADGILASTAQDLTVRIWDMAQTKETIRLEGHQSKIFGLDWSPDGRHLITVSQDQKIRFYDPRASNLPVCMGAGPQGSRGARIQWVMGSNYFIVSGFNKVSERQIYLYDANNPSEPLLTEGIDVSPAILIPHYDEDSSTLFLTGKGDSTIYAFEVASGPSHFYPLSHHKCSSPHQAVAFLPKQCCNVADVEFAKAFRLLPNAIEPLSFTVPRIRSELFQDDLFPNTKVLWKPTLSGKDWFNGQNDEPELISLRPKNMQCLSEAPAQTPKSVVAPRNKHVDQNPIQFVGDVAFESSLAKIENSGDTKERLVNSMKLKVNLEEDELPQNHFEGVDLKEWEEEN